MNKIKILPDNLANQIAAGEVVERPASVVKELLENALDAGANRLQIDIELGGRRLMRVSDDGEGMGRDDAILAFERHATSKLKNLEDLSKIQTLGFRGEALASIASVAKVELITKTAEAEAATRVLIEGGRLIDVKDAARSTGTTITVRELFFNTPARRKFMRSEATENYHLASVVTHYALANPPIAFTLINNGREILRVSPAKDLRERAYQIFGAQMIESLLKVEGGREFVAKISGFVSAPRERRTTRDAQYFFINGRFVKDKIIAGGLLEGFRAVLPHGVYPVAFLFLDVPFEEIDVNVHPAKTEVRFRRSEAVKEVIAEAVRGSLRDAGIVPNRESNFPVSTNEFDSAESQISNLKSQIEERPTEQAKIEFQFSEDKAQNSSWHEIAPVNPPSEQNESKENRSGEEVFGQFAAPPSEPETDVYSNDFETKAQARLNEIPPHVLTEQNEFTNPKPQILNSAFLPPVDSAAKIPKAIEPEMISSSKIRPLSQLHDSFIIAVDDEGLLLIDQHVAHERILFDKFRRKETERKIESQNLLLPETIDLTPAQSVAFDLIETELENLGFALMKLSGRTIAVKAVPTDLPASEVRNLLAEILDTVDREKFGAARQNLRDNIAASLACKAAVKINMKLTPEKMQWLIDKLLTTSSPTTCPHGRPVILRLTMKDIERGFHRT
ncbi:MAG TPA: DNA mismatch repair endonuclease MutL [Pyrinomonadaceae bacterium]|nr:DNA mismatch repair endonuclease MutL [Pyrinomonadaceae bacterium]